MPVAEQVESLKRRVREAVILFEHKEGSKLVDIKDVATLVRSLGVNPTGAQISLVIDQLTALNNDADSTTLIPSEHFEAVVPNFLMQQEVALFRDDYHTLLRAFRAFDPEGRGFIDAEVLRTLMSSRGEPMTDEEVNRMLANAADDNGRVYYEDYAQRLANDGRKI
mmetsp:Transcript_39859/g.88609  ORF Transcript_39859/g.88609 Transcript_39859/m.88609 type:complete len:166 (+) Transcript_39859:163-660(+)|eukprot:CAMPEP_0202895438 /NCGR_PEP_ID=MMETSP1392-20130828/4641_1 /ASSEMBLY_ACC=CAM_ASM_000868 /TAXON_ID=225041 /ORGANISM="Chlamydomonas chlamydogama, Strain SAG 11-48b" /LENGTH=165 /DNA_ID=CAMNT_0049580449 /DNA_START=159 /DNA_END=659 /DNA_ORIENTATION=-